MKIVRVAPRRAAKPAAKPTLAAPKPVTVAQLRAEASQQEAAYVATIIALCTVARRPELAAGFVRARMAIPQVRDQLQTLRADASDASGVAHHLHPDRDGNKSASVDWARAFAAAAAQR